MGEDLGGEEQAAAGSMDRIEALLRLYEDDPTDPFTLFALGYEHLSQGNVDRALHWYESIRAIAPEYTGVYYHLGRLYARLNRKGDALQAFQEGIAMSRKTQQVRDLVELQQALMELSDDE